MKYITLLLSLSLLFSFGYADLTISDIGYSTIVFDSECTEIAFSNPNLSSDEYFIFVSNLEFMPLRDTVEILSSKLGDCSLETESFLSSEGYTGKVLSWIPSSCLEEGINTLELCLIPDTLSQKTSLLSSSYFYNDLLPVIKRSDIDVYFSDNSKYIQAKVGDEITFYVDIYNSGSSPANVSFDYVRTPLIEEFVEDKELFRFLTSPSFSTSIEPKESLKFPITIKILKPETFSLPPVSVNYSGIIDRQVSSLTPLQIAASYSLDFVDCYFNPQTSEVSLVNNSQEDVGFSLLSGFYIEEVFLQSKEEKIITLDIPEKVIIRAGLTEKTCKTVIMEEDNTDSFALFVLLGVGILLALGAYFFIMKD